jgi:hypothetical protein
MSEGLRILGIRFILPNDPKRYSSSMLIDR